MNEGGEWKYKECEESEWSWEGVWGRVRDEWDHIRGMNDVGIWEG